MATNYHPSLRSQSDDSQSPYQGDQNLGFYSELPSYINNITTYNHFSAAGPYSEFFPGSSLSSHSTVEFPSIEARNEMVFIPPTSATMNLETIDGHISTAAGNPVGDSINGDSHTVQMPQLGVLDGEHNFHREGLSLSLGSQMQAAGSVSPLEHHFPSLSSPHLQTAGKWAISCDGYEIKQSKCLSGYVGSDLNTINIDGPHNPKGLVNVYVSSWGAETILKSKYLKAAQQLLDEVVNVKNALKQLESKVSVDTSKDSDGMLGNRSIVPTSTEISLDNGKSVAKSSSELLPAEREDLQNKKTKLLSMLDEVDRRYTQYCRHMRTMVSPFNIVAGRGAAKSYTALARQTISCHFRCLRDAISGQIEVVRRCLGEEDNSPSSQVIIRRLRYVDHKLRQQRALQQLGVTQHAWRPQRGLPESSVSILRAWLFEHFLHPYPNDNEKTMLARQTGLSRNQVANWFINARVRLWKPMVEEMYKEEFGDPESNFKSSPDNATNPHGDNHMASENKADDYELQDSSTSTAADSFLPGKVHNLKSNHTPDLEVKKPIPSTAFHKTSHEVHVTDSHIMLQYDDKRSNMEDQSLFPDDNYPHDRNVDRSLITPSTDMSQLSRFTIGSQVSLALGLQHHESDTIPLPIGTHFRGNNITEAMDYHFMDSIKQQDRFGNSHLLHDFAI